MGKDRKYRRRPLTDQFPPRNLSSRGKLLPRCTEQRVEPRSDEPTTGSRRNNELPLPIRAGNTITLYARHKGFSPSSSLFPFPSPPSLCHSYFVLVTVTPKYRQINFRTKSSLDFLEFIDESLPIPNLIVSNRVDRDRLTPHSKWNNWNQCNECPEKLRIIYRYITSIGTTY